MGVPATFCIRLVPRRAVPRVFLALSCTVGACVTVGQLSQREAVLYARNDVCGPDAADSICVVRSVEKSQSGYRIVIDRRPPAGRDRLLVDVRGGMFHDPRIEVTPVDTATRRPQR